MKKILVLLSLIFLVACGDEETDENTTPDVGKYVLVELAYNDINYNTDCSMDESSMEYKSNNYFKFTVNHSCVDNKTAEGVPVDFRSGTPKIMVFDSTKIDFDKNNFLILNATDKNGKFLTALGIKEE